MKVKNEKPNVKQDLEKDKAFKAKRWAFIRRTPSFFNWFEAPGRLEKIKPFIKKGDVIADIGCGWGYYTFLLVELVGPKGKVISIDLGENCIQAIKKKAKRKGYKNIQAFATTAADLSSVNDYSVDFVFANGLLCSMENDRMLAVQEMKRILKSHGHAYISLGAAPPFGLVDETEWNEILANFRVEEGGKFKELWAVVGNKR